MTDTAEDLFDFRTVADVPTGEHRVKLPDGTPTPMVITLAGPESPDRKARAFAVMRRKRGEIKRTGELAMSDPEDDYRDETDELVACTLGWRGAVVPFSAAAARELYTDAARAWLRNDVRAALARRELFIQRSAAA